MRAVTLVVLALQIADGGLQPRLGHLVEPLGSASGHDASRRPRRRPEANSRREALRVLLVGVHRAPWRYSEVRAGGCGAGFGSERLEARLMRVVAVGAEQVPLGAVPVAGAPAVHAGPPVTEFLAVALAAEPVGLVERHGLAAGQVERVAIGRIVAIEAPAVLFVVLEDDVGVHVGQHAAGPVRASRRGRRCKERCLR